MPQVQRQEQPRNARELINKPEKKTSRRRDRLSTFFRIIPSEERVESGRKNDQLTAMPGHRIEIASSIFAFIFLQYRCIL